MTPIPFYKGRGGALLVLLVAALWLATRPYLGVVDDDQFYTVWALKALLPGRFDSDLYFRYGSVDQFTVFSSLYGRLLGALGIAGSDLPLTIVGQCVWLAGLLTLARSLARDAKSALFAVAIAIALPSNLGFQGNGDAFLTPRYFAEALTYAAMGLLLRRRPVATLLLLVVSLPIHPLMTLAGFAVLFVHEAARNRIWIWLGILAVAVAVLLAFLGVPPLALLLQRMDPEWLSVARVRDYWFFVALWNPAIWLPIATTFALTGIGLSLAEAEERRFLLALLAVALGGIAVSLIGGDLFHDLFIIDVQPWRTVWLLAAVAQLFAGLSLLRLWRSGASPLAGGGLIVTLVLTILSAFAWPIYFAALASALATWLAIASERGPGRAPSAVARGVAVAILVLAAAVAAALLALYLLHLAALPFAFTRDLREIAIAAAALVILLLPLAGSAPLRRLVHSIPALGLASVLVVAAAITWDQRTPWVRFVDETGTPPADLAALLPDNLPIYWEGDMTAPWFLLKRPNYLSCDQGAAATFSRGAALEYEHRRESLLRLQPFDFGRDGACPGSANPPSAAPGRSDLAAVCRREPELGALVLTRPIDGVLPRVWQSPVEFRSFTMREGQPRPFATDRFFIYTCADLRP